MQPIRDLYGLRIGPGWKSGKRDRRTGLLWCLTRLPDTSRFLFVFLSCGFVLDSLIRLFLLLLLYFLILLLLVLFLHGIFVCFVFGDEFLSMLDTVLGSLLLAYYLLLFLILVLFLLFLFLIMGSCLLLRSFILFLFLNCFVFNFSSLSYLFGLRRRLFLIFFFLIAVVGGDLRLIHRAERGVKVQKAICLC